MSLEIGNLQRVVAMIGPQADVETLSVDQIESLIAYDPDTDQVGFYDVNTNVWYWSAVGTGGGAVTGAGEVLMTDGITAPPDPLLNEAEDDWLYEDE